MGKFVNALKDPNSVFEIQQFFGVRRRNCSEAGKSRAEKDEYIVAGSTEEATALRCGDDGICISQQYEKSTDSLRNSAAEGSRYRDAGSVSLGSELKSVTQDNVENCVRGIKQPDVQVDYSIKYKFWYYLFLVGTYLGDELGYALLLPFWFWNVDGAAARRVVLVWSIVMYIGQALKDVIRWPRPQSPPVVRLQKKWDTEYGMPSTHAMVGVALPTAIIYFSPELLQTKMWIGLSCALSFCILISFSRLYLGMHSLLDVVVGIVFCLAILVPVLPLCNILADALVNFMYAPLVIIFVGITLIAVYPTGPVWTPTRGDTTIILGTCTGVQIGFWCICYLRLHSQLLPENAEDSLVSMVTVYRTLVGYACLIVIFAVIHLLKRMVGFLKRCKNSGNSRKWVRRKKDDPNGWSILLDLSYKYVVYAIISFCIVYITPLIYVYLKISRPDYLAKC